MEMLNIGKKKILTVRTLGDNVLHAKAKLVTRVDDEIREFGKKLIETMYAKDGIGLAATQVGVLLRIVALHVDPPTDKAGNVIMPLSPGETELCSRMPLVLINPEIVSFSRTLETREEGCLSIPKIYSPVERTVSVIIKDQLLDGQPVLLDCGGLLARALQHELDHLDGVVYVQRVKSPDFEEILPDLEKIIRKSGNKNYTIKRLVTESA